MPRFNHAYDFAFEVVSDRADAEDVTPAMLRAALLERVNRLTDAELNEACGFWDTYEIDETGQGTVVRSNLER